MSEEEELVKKIKKAAKIIASTGMMPFPVTDDFIEIMKYYLDEEDVELVKAFKFKKSMTMDQLQKKLKDLTPEEIDKRAVKLAKKGFIFNQPSSSGVMIYRLMPIVMIGAFEWTYMPDLPSDPKKLGELKRLAELYDNVFKEVTKNVQSQYDGMVSLFKDQPPMDRTIPLTKTDDGKTIDVEKAIDVGEETVLPAQTVEDIIKKFDDIAVGNCFCRQYNDMLGRKCKSTAPLEVCFTFGKSARHVIQQGFARKVDKKEALDIMQKVKEGGLIHKAYHNKSNINEVENSICNCCTCCCDNFNLWKMGATPILNSTNSLSVVDGEKCTGCGTCEEKCPIGAIVVEDGKAVVTDDHCIGCGVCAFHCPEQAISLKEGMRKVFIPPPRIN